MHVNWKYWLDVINYHWASITVFGGLLVTSAIKSMPMPDGKSAWYLFFYDWGHTFFNLPNPREILANQQPVAAPPLQTTLTGPPIPGLPRIG